MFSETLITKAQDLLAAAKQNNIMIVTAESCTGGLISALLTEIAGSSAVFERGFATYSNAAKQTLLAVPASLIETYGAVSQQVVEAMAEGALKNSAAQLSIAVTGIAGPDGGTETKPVGLVYIGIGSLAHDTFAQEFNFKGSRAEIRFAALEAAIDLAQTQINETTAQNRPAQA